MKYTIFVSYSWENALHRVALVEMLKSIPGIDIKLDQKNINYGAEIWATISAMLDQSDCVVVILSPQSAKSFGVYQELVRAHDRGISILVLCHKSIPEDELPSFLRSVHRMPYADDQSFMEALKKLQIEIESRRDQKDRHGYPRKRIQSLLSAMNAVESKGQNFRLRILDEILNRATSEVSQLSASYTLDLGVETNFLARAKPLFSCAEAVFAVSVDSISTFWLKQDLVDIAEQYVRDQPTNTVRLFVFESPASAHQYVEILEAHNRRYGAAGAVLLCSIQSYHRLLQLISRKPNSLLTNDFAVLRFGGYQLAATLDSSRLHFHEIDLERGQADGVVALNYKAFVDILSILAKTDVGETNSTYREKFTVLRWSGDFVSNRHLWASKLKRVFNNSLGLNSGDIYHLVILRQNVSPEVVAAVRTKLREARINAELRFDDLWSGRRLHLKVADGVYNGAIRTGISDKQSSVLMFHFDGEDALRRYYSGTQHSAIRRELYETLSPKIRELYKQIDVLGEQHPSASAIYEQIEEIAAHDIERWDFVYDEKIDDLVMGPGHRFPFESI